MRFLSKAALLLGSLTLLPFSLVAAAAAAPTDSFKNINLSRTINLQKSYPRESITAQIENISGKDQNEYHITFPPRLADNIGALQVREETNGEILDIIPDPAGEGSYIALLPSPLPPSSQLSLSITYSLLHALQPLPRRIEQDDPQFLTFSFDKYIPTPYETTTQQTTLKFPSGGQKIASYSPGILKGSTLTYGPYTSIPATTTTTSTKKDEHSTTDLYAVRYENTTPLTTIPHLHRTCLVSHIGNTLSTEDAYAPLTNAGANLSEPFSRVAWTLQSWHDLTSTALKELSIGTGRGAENAWFVDDVGNVSTSHFSSSRSSGNGEGKLDVRPRYPVFGGWRYSFRVGWEQALERFLGEKKKGEEEEEEEKKTGKGEGNEYTLSLPLVQLPRNKQGVTVDQLDFKVILPEGAEILSWDVSAAKNKKTKKNAKAKAKQTAIVPARSGITATQTKEKSFLDTTGRTVLRLQLRNLVDEVNGAEVVVRYRLSWFDEVARKPAVVAAVGLSVLVGWIVVRKVNVSIKGEVRK